MYSRYWALLEEGCAWVKTWNDVEGMFDLIASQSLVRPKRLQPGQENLPLPPIDWPGRVKQGLDKLIVLP